MRCFVPAMLFLLSTAASGSLLAQSPGDVVRLPDGGVIYYLDPNSVAAAENLSLGGGEIGGGAPIAAPIASTQDAPSFDSIGGGGAPNASAPEPAAIVGLLWLGVGLATLAVHAWYRRRQS